MSFAGPPPDLCYLCLSSRHGTVPDAALPRVQLLVQFCNSLAVADCWVMHCQRVEVASYGTPFRKVLRAQTRDMLMRCNVLGLVYRM